MNETNEKSVLDDKAQTLGQLAHAALPGESVIVYTPTWIVRGTVRDIGPLVIELVDASIVYDTGQHGEREPGADTWGGLDQTPWPGSVIRVPAVGSIVVVL